MLKTLGNIGGGQPGTTWDNLFFEVVPRGTVENQRLASTGDTGDNLFVSLACGGKDRYVAAPQYIMSWEKVVPSVPPQCKPFILNLLRWDNLVFEVVPGCTTVGAGRGL